jgi:hypothetical protein
MSARGVLRVIEGGQLGFWCPGCKELHVVNGSWQFNDNYDLPTFSPSILVRGGHYASSWKNGDPCWCTFNAEHPEQVSKHECARCHSFVTDGKISFLSDCTHELAGETLTLEAYALH